jgi:N6-adenosine-specific RNA methylase IME4
MQKYRTIVADPPWAQTMSGKYKNSKQKRNARELPYPTMTVSEICALPVRDFAESGCHLYLWTTNEFLRSGFEVMEAWGFTYLAPIHWKKPSGFGNYWVHVTQTILFGYFEKCYFDNARYLPNWFEAPARKHSQKPEISYDIIERVSSPARLELFARHPRLGWDVWGNEVESNISIPSPIRGPR